MHQNAAFQFIYFFLQNLSTCDGSNALGPYAQKS